MNWYYAPIIRKILMGLVGPLGVALFAVGGFTVSAAVRILFVLTILPCTSFFLGWELLRRPATDVALDTLSAEARKEGLAWTWASSLAPSSVLEAGLFVAYLLACCALALCDAGGRRLDRQRTRVAKLG
jgi:hypothetical protein